MYRRSPLEYQDLETGLLELGLLTFVDDPEITLTAHQDPIPARPKRRPLPRRFKFLEAIAFGALAAAGGAIFQYALAEAFGPQVACAVSYHYEPLDRPAPYLTP
jgi:hypothetical protein